jgi:signal transduction histidine kinase
MAKLVANILDFARGRLGAGVPLIKQPDPALERTLSHVVEELAALYPGRVESHIDIAQPVLCDSGRIGQLLANLLSNALTHGTAETPVRVTASCQSGTFNLSVTNSGKPIPESTRKRLFQPFSRLASDRRLEGLGLGLYIASQIALAHGGELSVESVPEHTTFTLTMPNSP